ncbi:enkurin-like [Myzus persicae]|uniref:enkurin-like n=1 Tax=Myzus persicae TaxID=13164 RepID=UPI000B933AE6|nr:enkurin-like [Myzus persicae]XP_022162846.1 enkurin-like [Myzus persicae]
MNEYQENIKYLIQRPKTPVIKPAMHRSIFNKSIQREFKLNKGCHQTMGYAEVKVNGPCQFLKKNTRKVIRPFVDNTKTTIKNPVRYPCGPNKPSPKKEISKNFLRENIVDVVRRVPLLPKHRVQDSRKGHIIVLNEAGLEPTYVLKKDFGKLPLYIEKIFKKNETVRLVEIERTQAIKPPLRRLPEEECYELLTGLKTNWAELNRQFLLLPMLTDTVTKIKRKTNLENQLGSLEKDITLLEKYSALYVCNDDV